MKNSKGTKCFHILARMYTSRLGFVDWIFTFLTVVLPHQVTRLSQHRLEHFNPHIFNLFINLGEPFPFLLSSSPPSLSVLMKVTCRGQIFRKCGGRSRRSARLLIFSLHYLYQYKKKVGHQNPN